METPLELLKRLREPFKPNKELYFTDTALLIKDQIEEDINNSLLRAIENNKHATWWEVYYTFKKEYINYFITSKEFYEFVWNSVKLPKGFEYKNRNVYWYEESKRYMTVQEIDKE